MRTEGKESKATQRFQIEVLIETMGRNPTILHTKSKSEAHQKPASIPNSQIRGLSNLCSLDGSSAEEGLGPTYFSLKPNNAIVLVTVCLLVGSKHKG